MKIGVVYKFYESGYNRYGDKKYEKIKEHGFDCVDFSIVNTKTELYQSSEERFMEILMREKYLAKEAGVEIHQVHGPWWIPKDTTEEDWQEHMEKMQQSIRAAAILGCRYWVIHPIMPYGTDDIEKGMEKETWEINLSFMRKLLKTAKENNVIICIENMPFQSFSMSTSEKILQFVHEINDENFKICLDTGHVARFRNAKPGNDVRKLGKEIAVLHVHDNNGDRDTHQFPYTGIIDWEDFGKALKETSFNGVLSMETAPSAELPDEEFHRQGMKLAEIGRKIVE